MYDLQPSLHQITEAHLLANLSSLISLEIFIECFVRYYIITLFITGRGHVPNHHDRRMLFGVKVKHFVHVYMYEHEQVGIMSWLLLSRHYNKFNFIVITYSLA